MNGRKRLHISPLTAELLPILLPPPLLQQASNISYHTIQTFPEKNYGYLDLPEVEADRLKKKLNGSVLKGSKMRVELARREKRTTGDKEGPSVDSEPAPSNTSRKRRPKTREEGVIPGYELPAERKVKRGWTEPASSDVKPTRQRKDRTDRASKSKASTLTGEAECLFKTTLPPTASSTDDAKEGKARKRKRGDSHRDVVVHEFSNTTRHASFLRDDSGADGKKTTSEYIDGKGWVDDEGNVVEAPPKQKKVKASTEEANTKKMAESTVRRSRRSSKVEVPSVEVIGPKSRHVKKNEPSDDETSSSGSSSNGESKSESKSESEATNPQRSKPVHKATRASARKSKVKNNGLGISAIGDDEVEVDRVERLSITRSSATPPPPQQPVPTSAAATNEVHPLEALFKRPNNAASHTPKKPNLEVSTSFNFSEPNTDEGGSQGLVLPQTPFTQQDIRQRRQRSAAPTPDTAAPGKTFGDLWAGTSDVSEEDEEDEDADATAGMKEEASTGSKDEKQESDFSKWFWEHRGENNRAWKRRRREAVKEKRKKDRHDRKG